MSVLPPFSGLHTDEEQMFCTSASCLVKSNENCLILWIKRPKRYGCWIRREGQRHHRWSSAREWMHSGIEVVGGLTNVYDLSLVVNNSLFSMNFPYIPPASCSAPLPLLASWCFPLRDNSCARNSSGIEGTVTVGIGCPSTKAC